jgi:hypothetical protein
MPISLICPGCMTQMTAPDEAGGLSAKCPVCGLLIAIPPASALAVMSPALPAPVRGIARFSLVDDGDEDLVDNPFGPRSNRRGSRGARRDNVHLVEKTSKVWKAQMLASGLVMIVGAVVAFGACAGQPRNAHQSIELSLVAAAGTFISLLGFVWYVIARIGAWWFHG